MPEGLRPGSHSLEETGLDLPANVAMFSGTETVIRIEPLRYTTNIPQIWPPFSLLR